MMLFLRGKEEQVLGNRFLQGVAKVNWSVYERYTWYCKNSTIARGKREDRVAKLKMFKTFLPAGKNRTKRVIYRLEFPPSRDPLRKTTRRNVCNFSSFFLNVLRRKISAPR